MKNIILTILVTSTIWSCGGGSSDAQPCGKADCPVTIKMIHIQNEKNFNYYESAKIVHRAIEFINTNTEIKLIYNTSESIADPFPDFYNLRDFYKFESRYKKLERFLYDNRLLGRFNKRELTVIIDRPLEDDDGVIYTAGRAFICAMYQPKIALAHVTYQTNNKTSSGSYNKTYEQMFNRAVNLVSHEILHNLGAEHYEIGDCPECIMPPSFLQDVHLDPKFFIASMQTVNSANKCVKRETRRAIVTCRRKTKSRKHLRRCKARKRVRRIRLRDVKFREKRFRGLKIKHSCKLLGD